MDHCSHAAPSFRVAIFSVWDRKDRTWLLWPILCTTYMRIELAKPPIILLYLFQLDQSGFGLALVLYVCLMTIPIFCPSHPKLP